MGSGKKCPSCNSCLDFVHVTTRRFLHCWLEDIYYDIKEGKLVVINVEEEMKKYRDMLKGVSDNSDAQFK